MASYIDDLSLRLAALPEFTVVDVVRPNDPGHGGVAVIYRTQYSCIRLRVPVLSSFEAICLRLLISLSFCYQSAGLGRRSQPSRSLVSWLQCCSRWCYTLVRSLSAATSTYTQKNEQKSCRCRPPTGIVLLVLLGPESSSRYDLKLTTASDLSTAFLALMTLAVEAP